MSDSIETIEVKLPYSKKTALVRKRPTGADKEAILSIILNASDVTIDDKDRSTVKVNASMQVALTRLKIRRFLVECQGQVGSPEELYELAIALDVDDYDAITKVIDRITKDIQPADNDDTPKKKGTKSSTKS